MEILDSIGTILKYAVLGFVALIGLLVVLAILFGKRIDKEWEYEAKFYNPKGKEIGELDMDSWRYAEKKGDYNRTVNFKLRHPELRLGRSVQVYLDNKLIQEGMVQQEGRIALNSKHLKQAVNEPTAGQLCSVKCGGNEILRSELYVD